MLPGVSREARGSRSRSPPRRHTTFSQVEESAGGDFHKGTYCMADVRDLEPFRPELPSVCTAEAIKTLFANFNVNRYQLRWRDNRLTSDVMLQEELQRYMRYLRLRHVPGKNWPLEIVSNRFEYWPPKFMAMEGHARKREVMPESSVAMIKQAVLNWAVPYVLPFRMTDGKKEDRQTWGTHVALVVLYLNDSAQVAYAWWDSNPYFSKRHVRYIDELFAPFDLKRGIDLAADVNCFHEERDWFPVTFTEANAITECRRVATPAAGMCLALTALYLYQLYVRQYSVEQLRVRWENRNQSYLRAEAMYLVTAILLQLRIDVFTARYSQRERLEVENPEGGKNSRKGKLLNVLVDDAEWPAIEAIKTMNKLNDTARKLYESPLVRTLPLREHTLPALAYEKKELL